VYHDLTWSFVFANTEAKAELDALPPDARASFEAFGLERVREPYLRHIEGRIWEMRLRGMDGIALALSATTTAQAHRGGGMSRKLIPVEGSFAAWRTDPEYVEAYNALEDEFSLAAAVIEARAYAGLTQEQLAERMHTTQAVIARLESGRGKPSTRTLERLAAATGMRLRIAFEPAPAR